MTTAKIHRVVLFAFGWLAVSVLSAVQPRRGAAIDVAFIDPSLYVPERTAAISGVNTSTFASLDADMQSLGVSPQNAFYDERVGRWSSLILSRPMIPGKGVGNHLSWSKAAGPRDEEEIKDAAWSALKAYLTANARILKINMSELSDSPRISVHDGGHLIFIHVPRIVDGIPVRDNYISASINSGNLVLLGLQRWGDIGASVPRTPVVSSLAAQDTVRAHAQPHIIQSFTKAPRLELVPVQAGLADIGYKLVWVIPGKIQGDVGNWEGLVDTANGTLMSFRDTNSYADGLITGGVYPLSNDQRPPDGIEQTAWPMPFADYTIDGVTSYTDSGGNMGCIPGSITTSLNGLYIRMLDGCGAVNETGTNGIDLGSGPTTQATDCVVPVGHSAGDTKSSRSGFYELNRLVEQARSQLGPGTPAGAWVREQLTANMNVPDICNAFWDGQNVNFFRAAPQFSCANTGEIAAIFDHEWGHGVDDNGVNPSVSSPGEAVADIYAALRLNTSCIGRGFFTDAPCSGYGDACDGTVTTGCTGVRDINYMNHRCDAPHTISWIVDGFTDGECAGPGGAPGCPADPDQGPCGLEVHCEGMVMAETGWDLMTRDLLAPPFNMSAQTAHEVAARLLYVGAQPVGNWHTCTGNLGSDGCSASGGYLSLLAADDDDGNIDNGTPHMTAIYAAFARHEIHCLTPSPVNSGCAGAPTQAPVVTLEGQDRAMNVSWSAVPGATEYVVYRGDGVDACTMGKIIAGRTSSLSFVDTGLQNGRDYSYSVAAVGSSAVCMGPLSTCQTEQPVPGPNMQVLDNTPVSIAGDGDPFLDNCEIATIGFTVNNNGQGDLTNVRIVSITSPTNPSSVIVTPLPAPIVPTLASCDVTTSSFQIQPQGLTYNGFIDVVVEITADELGGETRGKTIRIQNTESDVALVPTKTYGFETDAEGWTVVSGTFVRTTGGGASGTNAHMSSSSGEDDQCDVIRSPIFILSDTSTLQLRLRFDIEAFSGGQYWDRANVSIYDVATGNRTVIVPSSGRPYNVPNGAANGTCDTGGQAGWDGITAGFPNLWYDATFNQAALNPGGAFTDRVVQIQINYGTDESVAGQGFDFDQVALTNFYTQSPDSHGDDCSQSAQVGATALAVDSAGNGVLEVGEVASVEPSWTNQGFAAVSILGTASNFTGPAGPSYEITDSAAAYGSLDPSETGACTDCYLVGIPATSRPSVHWDAQLHENIGLSSFGTGSPVSQKDWVLHVGGSFNDVATSNSFYSAIENVLHNGVTAGCGTGDTFCPTATVTRQQMAVFLLKAKEGADYTPPSCTTPVFDDVPCSSNFAPWINELSARGVTAGCGNGDNYCPGDPTNRQQMAVFLLKTEEGSSYTPPSCVTPAFDDVPCSSNFAPWINELVARQVTAGCGGTNYCPANPVARQQMAVFLVKTFGLVLYGP